MYDKILGFIIESILLFILLYIGSMIIDSSQIEHNNRQEVEKIYLKKEW